MWVGNKMYFFTKFCATIIVDGFKEGSLPRDLAILEHVQVGKGGTIQDLQRVSKYTVWGGMTGLNLILDRAESAHEKIENSQNIAHLTRNIVY